MLAEWKKWRDPYTNKIDKMLQPTSYKLQPAGQVEG